MCIRLIIRWFGHVWFGSNHINYSFDVVQLFSSFMNCQINQFHDANLISQIPKVGISELWSVYFCTVQ